MFLSRLILNPESADAHRDADSIYELHSTLMRLFASTPRDAERVLFRLEPPAPHHPRVVLIQSRTQPNFSALPHGYYLDAKRRDDYGDKLGQLASGQRFNFRLLANPTVKVSRADGGKTRKPLLDKSQQEAWLKRKLADAGAELVCGTADIQDTHRSAKRGEKTREGQQTFVPVLFEGTLRVTDPAKLCAAVETGLGSAKGYGFGLLSLAPA